MFHNLCFLFVCVCVVCVCVVSVRAHACKRVEVKVIKFVRTETKLI